jgi:threonine dehydrogenase-like Zn-dependent dehydrogenase
VRCLALLVALAGCASVRGMSAPADLVFRAGTVYTVDSSHPTASAVAVRGGRIVAVGLTAAPSPVDSSRLTFYERSLVGSLGYRHDLPRVVKLMADGLVDPEPLIAGTVPLGEAPDAFASLASAPGDRVKVMVDPHG